MLVRSLLAYVTVAFVLTGCVHQRLEVSNACDILHNHPDWYSYHLHFENKYAVPMSTVMAIIALESGYDAKARPVKSWLINKYIPWQYASSSYGYSQATNASWADFQRANPYSIFTRSDYVSSVAFVSWYLATYAVSKNILKVQDQYVVYHDGPNKALDKVSPATRDYAKRVAAMADSYASQLKSCRSLSWYNSWYKGPNFAY